MTVVPVLYATNRQVTRNGTHVVYGDRSASVMTYGLARVSIPDEHEPGRMETPRLRILWNPAEHVMLLDVENVVDGEFFARLRDAANGSSERSVLVFIHGYNVTFRDAVRRGAQLAYDLKFAGPVVVFSWPANGEAEDYPADRADVEDATAHLETLFREIRTRSRVQAVHAIAHSMGNEALTRVLETYGTSGERLLDEVVLTAPDVDTRIFERRLPRMLRAVNRLTLYASSNDRALLLSRRFWQVTRAGEAGHSLLIRPPLETVDASALKTDFLGHSYFVAEPVLDDLVGILRNHLPAHRRRLEVRRTRAGRTFWKFPRSS